MTGWCLSLLSISAIKTMIKAILGENGLFVNYVYIPQHIIQRKQGRSLRQDPGVNNRERMRKSVIYCLAQIAFFIQVRATGVGNNHSGMSSYNTMIKQESDATDILTNSFLTCNSFLPMILAITKLNTNKYTN